MAATNIIVFMIFVYLGWHVPTHLPLLEGALRSECEGESAVSSTVLAHDYVSTNFGRDGAALFRRQVPANPVRNLHLLVEAPLPRDVSVEV